MAYWKAVPSKKKTTIYSLGGGENNGLPPFNIDDSELTYSRNLDSRKYPSLCTRPSRLKLATTLSTNARIIGKDPYYAGTVMHTIDPPYWYQMDNGGNILTNISTSLSTAISANCTFDFFRTGAEDYVIFFSTVSKNYLTISTTALGTISDTNCPVAAYRVAAHNGRIYTFYRKTLHYSALNSITDWTTANDAGNIVLSEAYGNINALVSYQNKLLLFTNYTMHELYGSGPDDFDLINIENGVGCRSQNSITKCNGRLYWVGREGIYEYNGSVVTKISYPKVETYVSSMINTFGASIDKYVYWTFTYNSENLILKYDTINQRWFIEDGGFKYLKDTEMGLYGIKTDGTMWNMRSPSSSDVDYDYSGYIASSDKDPIEWSAITKAFTFKDPSGEKTLTDIDLTMRLSTNSTSFSVGYSTSVYGNTTASFTDLIAYTSGSTNVQNNHINMPITALQNVPWYRLRFAGTGECQIHSLQQTYRVKPR